MSKVLSAKRARKVETASDRARKITNTVNRMVDEHGYYGAIDHLLQAVQHFHAVAMADPSNHRKQREFITWVDVVEKMCERQRHSNEFEQRISLADEFKARGMGISLA